MAQIQCQPKFHSIFKKDVSLKCRILQPSNVLYINRSNKKIGRLIVQCCCSSSSSFPVSLTTREEEVGLKLEVGNVGKRRGEYEVDCFVNENGWKVRRMNETKEEMRKVAAIQAEAFHKPASFDFFKAKLLSGLVKRLRNSPPDRYACLVAEPSSDSPQDIVGVVNATVLRDKDVLHYFPGAEEYLYISGIAVLNQFRREKVATALLKACDVLARFWGFDYLVLRAYEGDFGARQLYTNAGYSVVSSDPLWNSTLIGRRRRVLMVKHESTNIH
ncbi:GCN5-related N-acetyltransferase 10, chloroplastic-like [Nicotiana tabacum]|uniref:GCN5-related N-acetyltransferase 10, chloroplastic-like n=2 Tax=Nicotiana TaxID=4085 RepID=A0A1S4B2J8_TOBAC|nr:PREDICTED: uncharacterized protein LOC104241080 [Nicotiana sylvestris]XP_016483051.1 PREDICTED: uncharacterized protein LOC107803790 [Nicotiana tabacum]